MNNLNDTLPDLMRRATDGLEAESNDLVQRGMRRGVALRRRRRALLSLSGAGAVLATAGIIIGGTHLLGGDAAGTTPVAGGPTQPTPARPSRIATAPSVPTSHTPTTLKKLLPRQLKTTRSKVWGSDKEGFIAASLVADDGSGAAQIVAMTSRFRTTKACSADREGLSNCKVQPDGSMLTWEQEAPEYPPGRNQDGIVSNIVQLTYPDGRYVALTSYNGPSEKGSHQTRDKPVLTIAQLTSMANSKAWLFPSSGLARPSRGPAAEKVQLSK
jgi:hypothetical protein